MTVLWCYINPHCTSIGRYRLHCTFICFWFHTKTHREIEMWYAPNHAALLSFLYYKNNVAAYKACGSIIWNHRGSPYLCTGSVLMASLCAWGLKLTTNMSDCVLCIWPYMFKWIGQSLLLWCPTMEQSNYDIAPGLNYWFDNVSEVFRCHVNNP